MKRLVLLLTAIGLLAVCGPAVAATPPTAQLAGFSCHRALDPTSRSMSIQAVMRPVAGTQHLSMRFDLLQRLPGATTWHPVTGAGDLGAWLAPRDRTLGQASGDVWQLVKTVYDLAAPARYEFRVSFRWLGAGNEVLTSTVSYSATCAQRELRPDLLVKGVTVTSIPNDPTQQLYTAVVANRGATAAGHFTVLFTPSDGAPAQTRAIGRLAAHTAMTETFVGPACDAADPPTVVADPSDQVDDYNRDNNTFTVGCPGTEPARAAH